MMLQAFISFIFIKSVVKGIFKANEVSDVILRAKIIMSDGSLSYVKTLSQMAY